MNRRKSLFAIIPALILCIGIIAIFVIGLNKEEDAAESSESTTASKTEAVVESAPVVPIISESADMNSITETIEQTPVNQEYVTMYVVDCDEWISLRAEPNTQSTRLTTIPLGSSLSYIDTSINGFYLVSYNGRTGYALAQYLSTTKPNMKSTVAQAQQVITMRVVNCKEWISLRRRPNTAADAVAQIPLGAQVVYIDNAVNGFYQVSYNGLTGYALAQYLARE